MKKTLIAFAILFAVLLSVSPRSSAQNGLFNVAIEDPSGLCAVVSHYNGFTVIEFSPPDQWGASFQSYDGDMVITADTILVTETEENYSASYSIRYKAPFTAEGTIVFNGHSYKLKDSDTRNSFCGGSGTVFSKDIKPTGTLPPPPPVVPLTTTARASATSGTAPLLVTFSATSSKPASFVWRDNGVVFGTGPIVTLVFSNASTHSIILTAMSESETATASLTITITKPSGGSGGNG